MSVFEALVMGVLQGLTEFLPVSSSGHLELASYLFGIEGESNLPFTTAVHLATVLSTVTVFYREIGKLFGGLFRFRLNDQTLYAANLLISMLPLIFVGLLFREHIESLFSSNLLLVGCMLILTAGLLAVAGHAKPRAGEITPWRALVIGIAQALAVIPGLSRSGATISAGLLAGVKREKVSEFSFLMVLVPIIGMNLLDAVNGDFASSSIGMWPLAAGFLAAYITGIFACRAMIRMVNRGKLIWFAVYCALLGLASIGIYLNGS